MLRSMAPVLVRGGPIVPRLEVLTSVQEPTALKAMVKAARLFVPIARVITAQLVLPRTIVLDLAVRVFRDQALVLSAAMAHDPGVAIATAPGVAIAPFQAWPQAFPRPPFTLLNDQLAISSQEQMLQFAWS